MLVNRSTTALGSTCKQSQRTSVRVRAVEAPAKLSANDRVKLGDSDLEVTGVWSCCLWLAACCRHKQSSTSQDLASAVALSCLQTFHQECALCSSCHQAVVAVLQRPRTLDTAHCCACVCSMLPGHNDLGQAEHRGRGTRAAELCLGLWNQLHGHGRLVTHPIVALSRVSWDGRPVTRRGGFEARQRRIELAAESGGEHPP